MGATSEVFKTMPKALVAIFGVFSLVPFVSLVFHELPWVVFAQQGALHGLLITLTYWVLPLCLCTFTLLRSPLFLPAYILQCVGLIIHCLVYAADLPLDFQLVRIILIACTGYIGFLFANKDFLYPFLKKNRKFWREARRFDVMLDMQVLGDNEEKLPALMQDCSVTGMGVRIEKAKASNFLMARNRGDRISVVLAKGPVSVVMPVEVVWIYDYGAFCSLGLRALDSEIMSGFVTSLTGVAATAHTSVASRLTSQRLLEVKLGQTALVLWIIFIALSFGMPAFAGLL